MLTTVMPNESQFKNSRKLLMMKLEDQLLMYMHKTNGVSMMFLHIIYSFYHLLLVIEYPD